MYFMRPISRYTADLTYRRRAVRHGYPRASLVGTQVEGFVMFLPAAIARRNANFTTSGAPTWLMTPSESAAAILTPDSVYSQDSLARNFVEDFFGSLFQRPLAPESKDMFPGVNKKPFAESRRNTIYGKNCYRERRSIRAAFRSRFRCRTTGANQHYCKGERQCLHGFKHNAELTDPRLRGSDGGGLSFGIEFSDL